MFLRSEISMECQRRLEDMTEDESRLTPRLSLTDWLPKFEVFGNEAISTGCFAEGPLRTRGVEKKLR